MRIVEKYYSFYVPALNRAYHFKRVNEVLAVKLPDDAVFELGKENLKAVFPEDYTITNLKASPLNTEAAWMVTATVKEWEE